MGFNVFVDIRLYEDVYYYNGKFYLPKNEVGNEKKDKEYLDNFVYDSIDVEDKECIELCNNLLMVKTLHSCFGHALIDHIVPIHWIMNDIDKDMSFQIIFRKKQYDPNVCKGTAKINSDRIDSNLKKFKPFYNPKFNTYQDMIELLTPFPLMFEHLLDDNKVYIFRKLYCYLGCFPNSNKPLDEYQRTVWNKHEYWPERGIRTQPYELVGLRRLDDVIFSNFLNFVKSVKNKYELIHKNSSYVAKKKVMVIGRGDNTRGKRNWEINLLKFIEIVVARSDSLDYKGIVCLEDYSFKEQVEIISDVNIVIAKHGSGLSNMIWLPLNSKIIEFDVNVSGKYSRENMHKRIAQVTNSKHVWFPLGEVDYDRLENEILN